MFLNNGLFKFNLFTNKSIDRKFVYHPSNSKANWFRMIVNLIIQIITQTGHIISRVMEAIKGPVKLIKRVKIAHLFLQSVSDQFHVIILSLPM